MEKIRLQKFIADTGLMSRRAAEEEIKNGNIKVYVLQDKVNFDGLSDKERLALWRKTRKTGNFKRYLPEESNQITTFLNNGMDR